MDAHHCIRAAGVGLRFVYGDTWVERYKYEGIMLYEIFLAVYRTPA